MSKELQELINYCERIGATIIRVSLDENRGLIQCHDGTPSTVIYNEEAKTWK